MKSNITILLFYLSSAFSSEKCEKVYFYERAEPNKSIDDTVQIRGRCGQEVYEPRSSATSCSR